MEVSSEQRGLEKTKISVYLRLMRTMSQGSLQFKRDLDDSSSLIETPIYIWDWEKGGEDGGRGTRS